MNDKRKYTKSEVIQIVEEYTDYYLHSPATQEVHFGCDCSCSGDSYSNEEWEETHKWADEAEKEFDDFCDNYGIEDTYYD